MLLAGRVADCIWEQTSQVVDVNPPGIQASPAAMHETASCHQACPPPYLLEHLIEKHKPTSDSLPCMLKVRAISDLSAFAGIVARGNDPVRMLCTDPGMSQQAQASQWLFAS